MNTKTLADDELLFSPFSVMHSAWHRIPHYTKVQFCTALVFGLLVHMYVMTNNIPNHDSTYLNDLDGWVRRVNDRSGRWFAFIPDGISGTYVLSWLNRLLALVYISISSCLIGACIGIRRTVLVTVFSAIMVSFIAVGVGLTYTGFCDYIFFSAMLSCLAAYLPHRFRYGHLLGVIPLLLSLAIYQAYLGFFLGLFVINLIRSILSNNESLKAVVFKALKYLTTLTISLALYAISLAVFDLGEVTTYAEVDTLGGLTLANIPIQLINTYKDLFNVLFRDKYGIHPNYLYVFNFRTLFAVAFVLLAILLIQIIASHSLYKKKLSLAMLIILAVMFPAACNVIFIVSPNHMYILMQYSLVLLFALGLSIIEISTTEAEIIAPKLQRAAIAISIWLLLIICSISTMNYAIGTNAAYLRLDVINKNGLAFSTGLVARIQGEVFYSAEKHILLSGRPPVNRSLSEFTDYHVSPIGRQLTSWYSYSHYLMAHVGLNNRVYTDIASVALLADVNTLSQLLTEIPSYPAPGSIFEHDGLIIVKLSG